MTNHPSTTAVEAALTIHSELSELLSSDEYEQAQPLLIDLLQRYSDGENTEDEILALLASTRPTRRRMSELYTQWNDQRSLSLALAGEISTVPAPRFQCPNCDESWSRDRIGRPVPICSTHKVLLKPV